MNAVQYTVIQPGGGEIDMKSRELCECSIGDLDSLPKPQFRLVCHCKTCQAFFGASHNDECSFLLKDCKGLDLSDVEFKSYQTGNSPIKRGKCNKCGKPKYCKIKAGPFPEFLVISTEQLSNRTDLPDPIGHIYYGSRVNDINDGFKKVSGHFISQLVIVWSVFKVVFKRENV